MKLGKINPINLFHRIVLQIPIKQKECVMRSKSFFLFSSLAILALLLAACGANSPAENTTTEIMDDASPPSEITPSVEVSNQDASRGMVTVEKVMAADPGWIVIHTESDGAPGPIVGFAQVSAGENNAVDVEIDLGAATEKLFAMLHIDAGTAGTYEFPGDDVPVKNGDAVVMTPFMVSLGEASVSPSVSVADQETDGKVIIAEVNAADPGWIVIHTESDGAPGPIIGYAAVNAGENSNVEVEIDLGAATEKLFAMLHIDAGTAGTYEFPGDDAPVKVGDAVVMTPFMITAKTGSDSAMDEVVIMVKDSKFEAKELTVSAGTTVTWIMDASFPHTVTADDGSFDSGRMSNGQSFSFTFDQPGEFPYYCTLHGGTGGSGMAGTVTVTN